ncbi:MAG: hypothetical protein O2894_09085 [Planctomycetota bacterium]|nr:hypothetical protein [Planctomycetota bacterium]
MREPKKPAGTWIPLVRIGGVRIYLDPMVAVLLGLLLTASDSDSPSDMFVVAGILLGSVLLHELAHAWMARHRGLAVGGIFLHLVPYAYVERGAPQDELRVALAGPALNLILAGLLFACPAVRDGFAWTQPERWFDTPLGAAAAINLLMGVFNLVPALPADGGRALRAGLMTKTAPGTAYAWTARAGTYVGAGFLFLAVLLWPSADSFGVAVLGVFFILTAWREARAGMAERARERARARDERVG